MKRWRTYLFAGCCAVVLGACTGNFRDLNDDKSGITDKELEADDNGLGYRLGIVQQGVYFNYDYGKGKNWPFQMIQNLNADMFSGYMHDPKPLQGGSHNSGLQPAGWLERLHVAVHLLLHHAGNLPAGADRAGAEARVLRHCEDSQGARHAPCDGLLRPGDLLPFRRPRQRIRARQPGGGLRPFLRRSGRGGDDPHRRGARTGRVRRVPGNSTCCSTAATCRGSGWPPRCACVWRCAWRVSFRSGRPRSSASRSKGLTV